MLATEAVRVALAAELAATVIAALASLLVLPLLQPLGLAREYPSICVSLVAGSCFPSHLFGGCHIR